MNRLITIASIATLALMAGTAGAFEIKGIEPGIQLTGVPVEVSKLTPHGISYSLSFRTLMNVNQGAGCWHKSEWWDNGLLCYSTRSIEPALTIAGMKAELHAYLDNTATIQYFYFTFASDVFETIYGAVTAKYGEPTEIKESTVVSGRGAQLTNVEMKWVDESGNVMTLKRFAGNVAEGRLSVDSPEYRLRIEEAVRGNISDL